VDNRIYKRWCVKYGHHMSPMKSAKFDGIMCSRCCYVYEEGGDTFMAKKEKKAKKDKKKKGKK